MDFGAVRFQRTAKFSLEFCSAWRGSLIVRRFHDARMVHERLAGKSGPPALTLLRSVSAYVTHSLVVGRRFLFAWQYEAAGF
jgi:hypothetical protein